MPCSLVITYKANNHKSRLDLCVLLNQHGIPHTTCTSMSCSQVRVTDSGPPGWYPSVLPCHGEQMNFQMFRNFVNIIMCNVNQCLKTKILYNIYFKLEHMLCIGDCPKSLKLVTSLMYNYFVLVLL